MTTDRKAPPRLEKKVCTICGMELTATYVVGQAHWGCPLHGSRGVKKEAV